jgi:hypothetical protein
MPQTQLAGSCGVGAAGFGGARVSAFCFLLSAFLLPVSGGLPISSVAMALPIVRAHICTLPIAIAIPIPVSPPLNSAPRTTTFGSGPPHPETKRSCFHNGRKKLHHRQPATALDVAAESRTPE